MVQDENDGSGEEDGHEADAETEDPVVCDADVEVEGGEDGAPHHHIEHLLEVKEEALSGLSYKRRTSLLFHYMRNRNRVA